MQKFYLFNYLFINNKNINNNKKNNFFLYLFIYKGNWNYILTVLENLIKIISRCV